MGTVVWLKNIRIEVRGRERNHIGRPHCHAVVGDCSASIDLLSLEVLETEGYSRGDLKNISKVIVEHREALLAKWEEYHGKKDI